jgi:hypothetical protein
MFLKRFILLFVTLLLVVLAANGQTPSSSQQSAEPTKKDDAKTPKTQAYELLDDVIRDIQRLRFPQNRAYLYVSVGDLLWEKDEKAARAILRDAVANLMAAISEQPDTNVAQYSRQRAERARLRERILFALARHDSRWTMDVLAETRPVSDGGEDSPVQSEAELETRLAAVIAANDPKFALELARKNLAKGFSYNLISLLVSVQEKDPAAASELAADILTKLKTTTLGTNTQAINVAFRLFERATADVEPKTKSVVKEMKPLLSDQSVRELAELIAAAVLDSPPESMGLFSPERDVLKRIEKYAPSRAQQLRRKFAQSETEPDLEESSYATYQKLLASGTAEDFIAAAEKADPGMRDNYYREATVRLINDDKADEARQLITSKITDPYQRKQMLAELDNKLLLAAATKGKMDETRKLLSTTSTNEERIAILTQLAIAVSEKGDKKTALLVLEEARNLSSNRPRYSRQLFARLQIAHAYASIDPSQSLAILETTVDQLNELISAGIVLGEFFGEEELVRDDEITFGIVGEFSDMFQKQFSKELALLATEDFKRTRDIADRFQRSEVRIMARLLVAQSVLGQKAKESDQPKDAAIDNGPTVTRQSNLEPVTGP